jgi:hypothetical protein
MIIDTNSSCLGKAQVLKTMTINAVGRYFRVTTYPEWAIKKVEAQELSQAGIKIFTVFEDYGHANKLKLTKEQGKLDASSAMDQALAIGQPQGSAIYFAVEGLPGGYKEKDLPAIREYFAGIAECIAVKYKIGAYSDGIVCKTLLDLGICQYTWLAAASASFQGTQEFMRSWRWSIAQMGPLDITTHDLSVDLNVAKDDFGAFSVSTPVA